MNLSSSYIPSLKEIRHKGSSLFHLRTFFTKLFDIISSFTFSPGAHLCETEGGENSAHKAVCHESEANPTSNFINKCYEKSLKFLFAQNYFHIVIQKRVRFSSISQHFVSIIRAGRARKQPSKRISSRHWNLPDLTPSRPQVPQSNVDRKVSQFHHQPSASPHVSLAVRRRRVHWVIDVVTEHRSKAPVVRRVFKNISHRHGSVAESVNEKGLEFSFGVVKGVANHCQFLNVACWSDHETFGG